MKRCRAFFVLLLLGIFCLSGCGGVEGSEQRKVLQRANAPGYDSKYITVGFIQTGKESDWRDANTNDFLNTFTKENGYNLIYIDGNLSSERQVKAAYDLIAQEVDYIIIDPIVENGWDSVLKKAKEEEGRENEDINIVILQGTEGASAAIGRTEGLMQEIEKHKNWKILTSECANFTQGEGKNVMEEILKNIKILVF